MHVLSQITIVYIITQHFINLLLYSSSILFIKYNNIVLYIPTYNHCDSGLPYYNRLNTLTNQIFIHPHQHAMMMFYSLAIVTEIKQCSKNKIHQRLYIWLKQRAAFVPSHTLYTTHTYTQ